MLKAAWHWGSDSRVVNDPLGEPDSIPLYVGLPSAWGSVEVTVSFLHISWEGSFAIASGDGGSLTIETLFGGTWRGSLTGYF